MATTYYWKTNNNDRYHWHRNCSKNHWPDSGWDSGSKPPTGREKCNECKSKDK